MAFSGIGKDYKGVSGGYTFEHKAEFSSKTGFGSVGGDVKQGSKGWPCTAKTTYKAPFGSVDASVTDEGKVSASLSKPDLIPGLATKLSATLAPMPVGDIKLDLGYKFASPPVIGGKVELASTTNLSKKTVLSSVGWSKGKLLLGAEAEYDVKKGAVSKYTLGAQSTLANGAVGSALLVDNSKALKLAYVQKVGANVTGGVEVVYQMEKGAVSGALAASAKLAGGATGKVLVNDRQQISLYYSADVQKNATLTVAVQADATRITATPKYGEQRSLHFPEARRATPARRPPAAHAAASCRPEKLLCCNC